MGWRARIVEVGARSDFRKIFDLRKYPVFTALSLSIKDTVPICAFFRCAVLDCCFGGKGGELCHEFY